MVRRSVLAELEEELRALGSAVILALRRAMRALAEQDIPLAQQVIEGDAVINARRAALEERCLRVLATQQPAASDLRFITGVMHVATDLERAADHAKGLARITLFIGDEPFVKPLVDLPRMAEIAARMVCEALEALRDRDVERARAVARRDDEVDALHDAIHEELFSLMVKRPEVIAQATYLMWASHAVERIADLATNICERAVFVATGVMEEMNPMPGEEPPGERG